MVVTSLWARTSTTRFILAYPSGRTLTFIPRMLILEEAITVANACGCTLDHDAELEHAYEVSRMTDETISSMVQDVTHHRETEIRIITGAVCRLGREHGIATPCNDLMLQLVLAKQSIYLGR